MRSRLLLFLFVAACNDDICSRHTDCAANQMCSIEGKCVGATSETTGDAGTDDGAPSPDATPDATPVDGAMP